MKPKKYTVTTDKDLTLTFDRAAHVLLSFAGWRNIRVSGGCFWGNRYGSNQMEIAPNPRLNADFLMHTASALNALMRPEDGIVLLRYTCPLDLLTISRDNLCIVLAQLALRVMQRSHGMEVCHELKSLNDLNLTYKGFVGTMK